MPQCYTAANLNIDGKTCYEMNQIYASIYNQMSTHNFGDSMKM